MLILRVLATVLLCAGCASGGRDDGRGRPRDAGPRDAATTDAPPDDDDAGPRDASRTDAGRDAGATGLCAMVDCSSLDGLCVIGVCDPADGSCHAEDAPAGASCDDASACTSGDACTAGSCAGAPVDCSGLSDACNVGTCVPATGMCTAMPIAGGACDDGNPCTLTDRCASGTCSGLPLDCSAMSDACHIGACNPATGTCAATLIPDGTACDDRDACTTSDACTGGTCRGTAGGCPGGRLMPGRTDLIASAEGWSVRCLAWTGRTCTHGQAMMNCSVCPGYAQCGVWHDVTTYNDGENRCSGPFCALATGNGTVLATGSGAAASAAPRACGWGSTVHPICEAARATLHPAAGGVLPNYGLLLDESYCMNDGTLRTFDCAGW